MASLNRLPYLLTTPVTNYKNNKEDQRKKQSKKLRIGKEIKMENWKERWSNQSSPVSASFWSNRSVCQSTEMNMDLGGVLWRLAVGCWQWILWIPWGGNGLVSSTLITKSTLTIHSSSTAHTSHPQPLALRTVWPCRKTRQVQRWYANSSQKSTGPADSDLLAGDGASCPEGNGLCWKIHWITWPDQDMGTLELSWIRLILRHRQTFTGPISGDDERAGNPD